MNREQPDFLTGGGKMGALIRAHDWSASPLGVPGTWPQSLRSVVGLMLTSRFPMFVAWGPELRYLYNDGYAEILGAKHPAALGCLFKELWPELWHDVEPLVERALAGEATYSENLPLTLRRNFYDEPCWFTFSYSPVRDESGAVAGMYCAVTETTVQVLAERNRIAELDRLHQLFHQAPGFMCVLRGPEHVAELTNAAYLRLIGGRDVIGKPVIEALPEVKGQGFIELLDEVYRTGKPYVGRQTRLDISRPGSTTPEACFLDFVYQPIIDAQGQVTGIFVEGSDVTEAYLAQQALIENQERLAQETRALEVLNRIGAQLVDELDVGELVQRVVDAGVELTGAQFGAFFYNAQRETGERMMLYVLSGADRSDFEKFGMPRPTAIFAPTFRGEGIIRSADITKDERYGRNSPYNGMPPGHLPVRSYLSVPVTSRSGEIIGGLFFGHPDASVFGPRAESMIIGLAAQAAIAIDNARLFQAAQRANEMLEQRVEERTRELALSEARSRAFFITSPDGRIVLRETPDGFVVVDMNPAALAVIGRRRDEVVGAHFGRNYSSPMAPNLGQRLRECLASDQPVRYEETRFLPAGERIFETILVAVDDPSVSAPGQGRLIIANNRDITEPRRVAEQLRQAQKMEAVGQLTGGVAHDFNNLLAGIIGSLELMQARIAQGRTGELGRYAGTAMASANRAAALTQRLLAFSRRQTLDPKPVNVNRLATSMEELIQRTAGPAIRVETVMSGGLWLTLCDPNQLESALLNLAINARDAMPDGGRLTIEAANTRLDDAYAAGQAEVAPGQYVAISVTDTGTGMPPEVIARAFEPFYTTKPIGQGTGLGLSMIYGFARQSGGHVRIYSEPGHGTTVRLYLPRYWGAAEDEAAQMVPAKPPATAAGQTALIVDDEPVVRMLVAEVLSEMGFGVTEAADGPEALRLLQSLQRFDLLITDVGLPNGMNGRQLADAARVLRRDLRVLFITGYAENAAVGNGHLELGMQVMTKPFALEALAAKIRGMMTPASVG